jgi:ATPase subunit of ABC transporter with duplicated ATPase domains
MADMDYGTLKVYPGNYDDYMLASAQARERQANANAAKERIAELQDFVRRFSANKSKARQATSRLKQIDKIKVEDIKPSSRQNPFMRFEFEKKLHNLAWSRRRSPRPTTARSSTIQHRVQPGERIAIIGENGAGKNHAAASLLGNVAVDNGTVKWAENANVGYMPQDTYEEFPNDLTLMDWMTSTAGRRRRPVGARHAGPSAVLGRRHQEVGQGAVRWREGPHDLGQADAGPPQRAADGRADQPHGHGVDRVAADRARKFEGTLIFVSHDREFVSGLANRIIEVRPTARSPITSATTRSSWRARVCVERSLPIADSGMK